MDEVSSLVGAVCCSVLQCVAVCCRKGDAGHADDAHTRVLQCVAVCCNVLQCVAVCCRKGDAGHADDAHTRTNTHT